MWNIGDSFFYTKCFLLFRVFFYVTVVSESVSVLLFQELSSKYKAFFYLILLIQMLLLNQMSSSISRSSSTVFSEIKVVSEIVNLLLNKYFLLLTSSNSEASPKLKVFSGKKVFLLNRAKNINRNWRLLTCCLHRSMSRYSGN